MTERFSMKTFEEAVESIRAQVSLEPRIGLILGSGLSPLADTIEDSTSIPYADIPHFPVSTVSGHAGQLVIGQLEQQNVVAMQGRTHYYEGYAMEEITFPVRIMQLLGIETLIVTNAAGGLNPAFTPGEPMLIADHINLVGLSGANPLRGPNLDSFGPRFPDMTEAYDPDLRRATIEVAQEEDIPLQQGVYVCLAGPNYETPAELRFLQVIGADAVGMSTVPEVIVARHGGTRVLGISGITNVPRSIKPRPEETEKTTHEEVLETGKILVPRLEKLIRGVLRTV